MSKENITTEMRNAEKLKTHINNLKMKIVDLERKKEGAEPEQFTTYDKQIGKLKRHLDILNELNEPEDIRGQSDNATDDVTMAKIRLSKLYTEAVEKGVDFNDTSNYMLISAGRLKDSIERLETLNDMMNDEYKTDFPDWSEFMKPLCEYVDAWQQEKDSVVLRVLNVEKEIEKIENELQEAQNNKDIEKIITCSDQLDEAKNKRKYMLPLIDQTENSKVFPDGEIERIWRLVCDIYGYEWRNRLEAIRISAKMYHKGIRELKELDNELRMVRERIQQFGKEYGSDEQIITYRPIIAKDVSVDSINLMGRDENSELKNMIFFPIEKML